MTDTEISSSQATEQRGLQLPVEQGMLKVLVPVNALTVDHLNTLLRDQFLEVVIAGQPLFRSGEYDNHHVYLLSGQVVVTDDGGRETVISAEDPACRYPLKHYQPRRHTAITKTDCGIIRFDSDQLDGMLAWDQASNYIMLDIASQRDLDEDADWMLTLLKSNMFYKVPPMNIRQILNKFSPVVVTNGETILRQGEEGDCCYFIKEGLAGVYQFSDEKSRPELVAELGVGRCFGEDALVNDTVRNATITMHSNGVLMKLDKKDFFLLLKPAAVTKCSLAEAKVSEQQGAIWIDVRTQDEFEKGHYAGAINLPLNILKLKSRILDKDKRYIVYCNTGRRSEAAAFFLNEEGFDVALLAGGYYYYSVPEQKQFESHDT